MGVCLHRWSTIKRWKAGNNYFVIQRCRKCDEWIRREFDLLNPKMEIIVKTYTTTRQIIVEKQKSQSNDGSSSDNVADNENL